jgi:hypothetical protein
MTGEKAEPPTRQKWQPSCNKRDMVVSSPAGQCPLKISS